MLIAAKRLAAVILVALTGCAATVTTHNKAVSPVSSSTPPSGLALHITGGPNVQASPTWSRFRAEWRTAIASEAETAGLTFTYLGDEPGEQSPGVVLVLLTINKYRYVSPGSRAMFGVMTGNAFIDSQVQFFEFPGKRPIGTRSYATSSTAWEGVFSAMTDAQVAALSKEIVREIAIARQRER